MGGTLGGTIDPPIEYGHQMEVDYVAHCVATATRMAASANEKPNNQWTR